jgi:histidinol-phosphate phosphatase family protein
MLKAAAFLDFQGTLGGSGIDDIRTFTFYPFSIKSIKMLNESNILAIGITNQSHIAKGELTMEEYYNHLERIENELNYNNAYFDAVYCCPHSREDKCNCKKPAIGMIDFAKADFEIDLKKIYVIGDMGGNDMVLAKNVNAKGILVLTGTGKGSLNEYRHTWKDIEADYVAENVLEAVEWIIGDIQRPK